MKNSNKKQQEENTVRFREAVKMLKDTGKIQFDREIIEALDWNKTIFSQVINGTKLIPDYRYNKFNEVYQIDVNKSEPTTAQHLIQIDAKCDVILSVLGEILANQKGHTADKIKDDLIASVNKLITGKSRE